MSKVEVHKCDVCDKTLERRAETRMSGGDGQYVRPPYDWLWLQFHSNYQDKMGEMVNTSGEVCSTACAKKLLTKALERLDAFEKWSVEEEARQKRLADLRAEESRKEWEAKRKESEARGPGFRG
jgi:hypothetical protein